MVSCVIFLLSVACYAAAEEAFNLEESLVEAVEDYLVRGKLLPNSTVTFSSIRMFFQKLLENNIYDNLVI